jgi:hypothetical protein
MVTFKTLIVSTVVAAALAVIGVTALLAAINPSASEVASNMADNDPMVPPDFYGTR